MKHRIPKVSIETLREVFSVDPDGRLIWMKRTGPRCVVGAEAGVDNGLGYRVVRILGEQIVCHRIVFAITHGRWPSGDLDHINGKRSDNRPENLRECTRQQNCQNRTRVRKTSSSGVTGVFHRFGRWSAEISHGGKRIYLGWFDNKSDAVAARRSAELSLFKEFAPV